MKIFPCAKINLGLNVVARRTDGYHDLETVFYPIPLCDEIEIKVKDGIGEIDLLQPDGIALDCDAEKNLVVRAYRAVSQKYPLPSITVSLTKRIPTQAGLGGGSSDAAYMISGLNTLFSLGMSIQEQVEIASKLGADCAFFIESQPAFATGIGEQLSPIQLSLEDYHIAIVKPPVSVSTREAFSKIVPQHPQVCCRDAVKQPMEEWKELLSNDFEKSVFALYPQIEQIKQRLYAEGAVYAQMSGSGSALFGIFKQVPNHLQSVFPDCQVFVK